MKFRTHQACATYDDIGLAEGDAVNAISMSYAELCTSDRPLSA